MNFETGNAKITAESKVQDNNMYAILKAYPALSIKIGGYTDVASAAAANKKISQERADAVASALKAAGSAAAQI
ncbi:MAG: OmpA family protein [Ferruginibacter sp.]